MNFAKPRDPGSPAVASPCYLGKVRITGNFTSNSHDFHILFLKSTSSAYEEQPDKSVPHVSIGQSKAHEAMIATSKLFRHIGRTPELFDAWRQTPEWLNVTKRYLEIGSPTYPFNVPLSGGGSIRVNSPGELKVFWQIFVHRCYILPTHCETILDAGANVGLFAVWAARERTEANIFSLEPFPSTFQHLERNINENGLQPRIRSIQCGLASATGERLMRGGSESPNNSVVLSGMEGSAPCAIPVSCVTLADFMKNEALAAVDLLKMDIEGSEWEVVLSTSAATLRKIRNIIMEYHEVNARYGYTFAQLATHLSSAGHRLTYREENTERTGLAFFQSA